MKRCCQADVLEEHFPLEMPVMTLKRVIAEKLRWNVQDFRLITRDRVVDDSLTFLENQITAETYVYVEIDR